MTRSETRWVLLGLAATALGCSGSKPSSVDGGGGVDAGGIVDAGPPVWAAATPQPVAPSKPGFLAIGPTGLVLAPGATRLLDAQLYDSNGNASPPGALTWSSSDPAVITVDTTGRLTAVAAGVSEIIATDGAHGEARLAVRVSSQPPSGATGVSFDPPVLAMSVGDTRAFTATVTDASGNVVLAPGNLKLLVSPAGAFSLTADGKLQATAPGAAVLGMELADQGLLLDGQAYAAAAPSVSGGTASSSCPPPDLRCGVLNPPTRFTVPGLSAPPLRAWVLTTTYDCSAGLPSPSFAFTQQSPDEVHIEHPDVISMDSSGLLTSVAPGSSLYLESVAGQQCGDGSVLAQVGADLGGSWSISCTNGDRGTIDVPTWPRKVISEATSVSVAGGTVVAGVQPVMEAAQLDVPSGTSDACNGPTYSCQGGGWFSELTSTGGAPTPSGPSRGVCAAQVPCTAAFHECGESRHEGLDDWRTGLPAPIAQYNADGTLTTGVCTFSRGGTGDDTCVVDAGPQGTCATGCATGFHCDGTQCVLNGSDGPLEVTLQWSQGVDLDLHLIEPGGCEISYANRTCVGTLDVDSNPSCNLDNIDIENVIYAADSQPPSGTYTVKVDDFADSSASCAGGGSTIPYQVVVRKGTSSQTYPGSFPPNSQGSSQTAATFTYP